MTEEYKILAKAYKSIEDKVPYRPDIAIILGSGLGDLVDKFYIDASFNFKDIKNIPITTNKNHKGKFIFTRINNVNVLIMQGRLHFYEGYLAKEAVRPVRLANMLGAKAIIITNASGGINKTYNAGDIMLIKDHISLFAQNPLYGPNIEEFGKRFPDMSDVYSETLRKEVKKVAVKSKIKLHEGIFVQLRGPSFETPAEIKFLQNNGVDAVAMSTSIEAIAAVHAGMKVIGLACIMNKAAGLSKEKVDDDDANIIGKIIIEKLYKLIINLINKEFLKYFNN